MTAWNMGIKIWVTCLALVVWCSAIHCFNYFYSFHWFDAKKLANTFFSKFNHNSIFLRYILVQSISKKFLIFLFSKKPSHISTNYHGHYCFARLWISLQFSCAVMVSGHFFGSHVLEWLLLEKQWFKIQTIKKNNVF